MELIGILFSGISGAALYFAIPTMLFVYGSAMVGDKLARQKGFRVAGRVAALISTLPFTYIAGMLSTSVIKSGFKYPQYGDEFLGFYLLGGTSMVALVATATLMFSERPRAWASRRRSFTGPV